MTRLVLSPAAQFDIDKIWEYTAKHWSIDQAERYVRDIGEACRELAAGERVSQAVDVRPGYRKLAVGSHLLFFRTTDDGTLIVVRILHQRMDVGRHL